MIHLVVLIKETKTLLAICLGEKIAQLISAAKDGVEFIITEAYLAIVGNSTSVIYLLDISPHGGAQTHVARFSSSVKGAVAQIVCA